MPYKDPEKQRANAREHYHKPEVKAKIDAFRKEHPEIIASRNKANYDATSPEDRRARQVVFLQGHPEYKRTYHLRYRYGLTPDSFEAMLRGQGGTCAVCHTTAWGKNGPHVDHDHETGIVRGILCFQCNASAGLLGDNPERALALAKYLQGAADKSH